MIWWFAFHSYAESSGKCQRELLSNNFEAGSAILRRLQNESNLARVLSGRVSEFLSRVKGIISDPGTLPTTDLLEETLAADQSQMADSQAPAGVIPGLADLQTGVDLFNIKMRAISYEWGEPSSTPLLDDTDDQHESMEPTRAWDDAHWGVLQHLI